MTSTVTLPSVRSTRERVASLAIKLGAVDEIVPLPQIPEAILQALAQPVRA